VVSKALLELAARSSSDFLFDEWKMATGIIERFKKEPPYGWILPATQRDPNTTTLMLDRLLLSGVEVYQSYNSFTQEGVSYPKGSYIIPTSQPYGLWVKSLLEQQNYPDLRRYPQLWQAQAGPRRYYDTATNQEMLPPMAPAENSGWTMPLLMGIESRPTSRPLTVAVHQVKEVVAPPASLSGTGPRIVFSHDDNNSFKAVNRIQKAGGKVGVATSEFMLGEQKYPLGTFVVDADSLPASTLDEIASATHVPMAAGSVPVDLILLPKPRIGLYVSWDANMDAGWMTFLFDEYEFPYSELRDRDVRAGNLRERFDVIILPDQRTNSIVDGNPKGSMPDEYVGGLAQAGVEQLKEFVQAGGTLICNKSSLDLAIDMFHLPVKNVLRGLPQNDFLASGSILRVDYDTSDSMCYGMERNGLGYISGAYAFDIVREKPEGSGEPAVKTIARFPEEPLLASGFLVGEEYLRGKAVVLEATVGQGRVVLFGFNVVNRAESHATHKLLYNAIFRSTEHHASAQSIR
jgi:hypothetical protein